jgi:Flp pilus assembly protein TadG
MANATSPVISMLAKFSKKSRHNEHGNAAMIFAGALLPLLGFVGLSIDGGKAYLAKSQLSSAVDVTALAATRLYSDANRDNKAKEFFAANFAANYHPKENANQDGAELDKTQINITSFTMEASEVGNAKSVTVTASAQVPTYFMKLFGIPTVTVTERAKASRTDGDIELVMALDNTGSMALNIGSGISRLSALKTAASTLVDSMIGAQDTNAQVRIGIVPYTAYVNVGRLLEPGFVQSVPGYTDRAATDPLGWKGCVDADASNTNVTADLSSAAWNTAYDTQEARIGSPVKPSLFPSFGIKYDRFIPAEAAKACSSYPSGQICQPATVATYSCVEGTCISGSKVNPAAGCKACTAADETPATAAHTQKWWQMIHSYNTGGNDALFGRANPAPAGLNLGDVKNSNYEYFVPPNAPVALTYKIPAALVYPSKTNNRSSEFPQLIESTSDNNDNATETINEDTNGDGAAASPNTYCPQQALPLANNSKAVLKSYINSELKAFFPDWGTLSSQGLLWSWRMVSAALPLRGLDIASGSKKAVVLMTDGEIFHPGGSDSTWVDGHDGRRTSYGFGSEKTLVDNVNATRGELVDALYQRLRKTCENMRRDGITIYTITLDPSMSATGKEIYRSCATSPSYYFDTPDAAALTKAFEIIADSLSGVRLVE